MPNYHSAQFEYIKEHSDQFLSFFPHRGSFLWASHPVPNQSPQWQTETKHLLSDRLILQGSFLYGVRFGSITNYLLIDLDSGSPYHPSHDPYAVTRIKSALEAIGLSDCVAISSSYSGGIHLYFPFSLGIPSWQVGAAATAALEAAGLHVAPGRLETFPNARRYSEQLAEFNGHRLPLQSGSYLLNPDFEPIYTTEQEFCRLWAICEESNQASRDLMAQAIKQLDRKRWSFLKASAAKFFADLTAEIEQGWSSPGQTNRLIGRIALREYVFYGAFHQGQQLGLMQLCDRVMSIAIALPGYREFCRHKNDLEEVVFYWCRSVETSKKYYPYGSSPPKTEKAAKSGDPTWNDRQALEARSRIESAVHELKASGAFPEGIRARIYALKSKGISSTTLYKYRDLWHLDEKLKPSDSSVIHPDQPIEPEQNTLKPSDSSVIHPDPLISFMCDPECPSQGAILEAHLPDQGGAGGFSTGEAHTEGIQKVRAAIAAIRRRQISAPSSESPPPDAAWFAQMQGEIVPPTLAGQGKAADRVQRSLKVPPHE